MFRNNLNGLAWVHPKALKSLCPCWLIEYHWNYLIARWEFEKVSQSPQFFYKDNQGIEASVALLLGNCFLINMLGTIKGHNDRLLQPTCRFSLAAIFILEKEKRWARVAQEVQDHIIHRALVKIPSDLICIIESIRHMSVDISCRKRPGAEEDLCMPVILQLLLACLSPRPQCGRLSSRQRLG
jgi:hypothetical protein